ncbi:hypothetical protein RHGRI_033270 [Rhododendron griersonianum]|uniref:Cystatin domain-containing protein n=1 Tax=Rhododendron griersonianum TaxID=479676 RepID=A0AAV6HYN3_9ERIC|nr:hypothetical protein RHGRI_033270 [Rhododendron griersonianum]
MMTGRTSSSIRVQIDGESKLHLSPKFSSGASARVRLGGGGRRWNRGGGGAVLHRRNSQPRRLGLRLIESRSMETEMTVAMDFAERWSDDTETSEDESEVFSLVKIFGYDKNLPPILTPGFRATDTDDDSDSEQDMTEEEDRLYSEQVEKSGGFDVGFIPGVNMLGQIFPMDIEDKRFFDYDFGSQLAVDEYRLRFKSVDAFVLYQFMISVLLYKEKTEDEKRELEFVKVLKVMSQVVNGVRFYITFEAKDLADGDKIKIYQAVVLLGVGNKITVKSFRLKPPEDGQGKVDSFH